MSYIVNVAKSAIKSAALSILDHSKHRGHDLWRDLRFFHRQMGLGGDCLMIDVGANVGQTAVQMAASFPHARILSFEPVQRTFDILQENIKMYPNVEAVRSGLGAVNAHDTIFHQKHSTTNSLLRRQGDFGTSEEISVRTFDDFCRERDFRHIFLFKSDTEGYDIDVLKGASEALAAGRIDYVLIETRFLREMELPQTGFMEAATFLYDFRYNICHTYEHAEVAREI